jgi:hypothetical protein
MPAAPKDFTPTAEQISLHGLGFIQIKLEGNQRLHVWHPDLPRRACFEHSPIHNHRFSFTSTVLVGVQVNRLHYVAPTDVEAFATHDIVSHDGPRSPKGGRESYVSGLAMVNQMPDQSYPAGLTYHMRAGEYHETPNSGIVVTLMKKLEEDTGFHACSLIERGHTFDQDFDRFQLPPSTLWAIAVDALSSAA